MVNAESLRGLRMCRGGYVGLRDPVDWVLACQGMSTAGCLSSIKDEPTAEYDRLLLLTPVEI